MNKTVMTLVVCAVLTACGGTPGEQGPKGDKGDTGAAGAAGLNQATEYLCLDSSGYAMHDIYKFPDGSVLVYCQIDWTAETASGFTIYKSTHGHAADAQCTTSSDNAAWASFSWNGSTQSTLTVHASTIQTYTLNCTKY